MQNEDRTGTRESALKLLEETRQNYLIDARTAAERIAADGDGTCTVDQVREVCPPPADIDGRVMGAVFNTRDWEHHGYERSSRGVCHKRPISRFRYLPVRGGSRPASQTNSQQ